MVKKEVNDVLFKIGDQIKVYLDQSTVDGQLLAEDCLGLTVRDTQDKTKYRFIPWNQVMIVEYQKGDNSVEKR